jgi:hypothetical protein
MQWFIILAVLASDGSLVETFKSQYHWKSEQECSIAANDADENGDFDRVQEMLDERFPYANLKVEFRGCETRGVKPNI